MNDDELDALKSDYEASAMAAIKAAKALGYYPGYFVRMVNDEGSALGASKRLLRPPASQVSEGLWKLKQLDRLDLSVEWSAGFDPRFEELFTPDERMTARERLALLESPSK